MSFRLTWEQVRADEPRGTDFVRLLFFFQAEDGIRDLCVTRVQTCALLISSRRRHTRSLCDWSSDVCSSNLSTLFPYTTLFCLDRKSTRLNSSHTVISYAVFCLDRKSVV